MHLYHSLLFFATNNIKQSTWIKPLTHTQLTLNVINVVLYLIVMSDFIIAKFVVIQIFVKVVAIKELKLKYPL